MLRIAIVGFGFAGNVTLAHLVRSTTPCEIYVIDPHLNARGVAYSTPYREHLLNVRASNMSAFADAPEDFVRWLGTQQLPYTPNDFVPRKIYGEYLEQVFHQSQQIAAQHGHRIKLVPSLAVAYTGAAVMTERGDAIAVDRLVLAVGNEFLPKPSPVAAPMVQDPWQAGALQEAAQQPGPILLYGSGLTAVDVVLALRHHGYAGTIYLRSRHRLLPHAHRDSIRPAPYPEALHTSLAPWRLWMRSATRAGDWRAVVDGLRPVTQTAWQLLSTRDKIRFFRRLASFWNVHRHRMAPQIAARIAEEQAAGTVVFDSGADACLAINCTGPELNIQRSQRPLLKNLLSGGLIEPHATSIGIAVDPQLRAWGGAYPNLYAMGSLLTGQWLESTAVPELRVQAKVIAEALCKSK